MRETKRALIGERRRRRLRQLASSILSLGVREYPDLKPEIRRLADSTLERASRSREGDRAAVLTSLTAWRDTGLTVSEIADEVGFTEDAVRLVLDELLEVTPPRVSERARDGGRGRPAHIYILV
jgi:hypothetical protein